MNKKVEEYIKKKPYIVGCTIAFMVCVLGTIIVMPLVWLWCIPVVIDNSVVSILHSIVPLFVVFSVGLILMLMVFFTSIWPCNIIEKHGGDITKSSNWYGENDEKSS
jgi:hypothetical protein